MTISFRQCVRDYLAKFYEEKGFMPSGWHVVRHFDGKGDAREIRRVVAKFKQEKGVPLEKEETVLLNGTRVKLNLGSQSADLEVNSLTIHTVDQALEVAKVDLDAWEVVWAHVNSWQVTVKVQKTGANGKLYEEPTQRTNYQVKVRLKPRVIRPFETALISVIERMPEHKPIKLKLPSSEGEFMLELALYDAHFGKLAWAKETGQQNYDSKIAEEVFSNAVSRLVSYAGAFKISKILFPIGQDFFHAENFVPQTPKGHNILDVDSRMPKIFERGIMAMINAVDACAQIAPVELIWIPGNHDPHASYFMAKLLQHHYRTIDHVSVNTSPEWRKCSIWGNCLIGFSHGDAEKRNMLPAIMAQFWPQEWAASKWREWHVGHFHKKHEEKFQPTQTVGGVIIRQIPTLSAIDAWHYQYGYVDAVRAGEAFLWDKNNGVIAHYTANVEI